MAQHSESIFEDPPGPACGDEAGASRSAVIPLAAARARVLDQAGAALANELNGPLTALLLYMGELKQQSDKQTLTFAERACLQAVVESALEQTRRVCALVKQFSGKPAESRPFEFGRDIPARTEPVAVPTARMQRPLTPRESEVLRLVSKGLSNKQGAIRLGISPRTFESHRAEAMRKLGVRNTAELVRAALLNPLA